MEFTDQIYTFKSVLTGDAGWLTAFFAWIGLARFLLKIVNKWIEEFFTGILSNFPEDHPVKKWAIRVTSNPAYTFIHWLVNWITSLSMPKFDNITKQNEKTAN